MTLYSHYLIFQGNFANIIGNQGNKSFFNIQKKTDIFQKVYIYYLLDSEVVFYFRTIFIRHLLDIK